MGILWNLRHDERRWATASATTEWENSCTKESKGVYRNVRYFIFYCFPFLLFRSKSNDRDCSEKKKKMSVGKNLVHFSCSSPWIQNRHCTRLNDKRDFSIYLYRCARIFYEIFAAIVFFTLMQIENSCSICFNDTNNRFMWDIENLLPSS